MAFHVSGAGGSADSNNGSSVNLNTANTENWPFTKLNLIVMYWIGGGTVSNEACSTPGFTLWQHAITGQAGAMSIFVKELAAGVQIAGSGRVSWSKTSVMATRVFSLVIYDDRDLHPNMLHLGGATEYTAAAGETSKDLTLSAEGVPSGGEIVFSMGNYTQAAYGGGNFDTVNSHQDAGLTSLTLVTAGFSSIGANLLKGVGYRDDFAGPETTHFVWSLGSTRVPGMGMRRLYLDPAAATPSGWGVILQ